ncbi:YraN family protein [Shewanella sp. HN-41]|uniref:YraN family protein n=1 Tax=Shewanella sp. HN-41 TaxID=327275 RepID=UPI00021269D4|nr:YraN family protein [Shewanella sp. HN-41]EGM68488.1 putative endonuclease [Shewanella sp. HN-41]
MTLGQQAETLAQRYLEQQGLTFVERNVRYPFGEIDLVMRHQKHWVFVEVKYRSANQFGGALQALSKAQIGRIRKAASHYLQLQRLDVPCRFDVIAMDEGQIHWLVDAF